MPSRSAGDRRHPRAEGRTGTPSGRLGARPAAPRRGCEPLSGEAVPEHANGCERDHQDNDQTSRREFEFPMASSAMASPSGSAKTRSQSRLTAVTARLTPTSLVVRRGALEASTIFVGQASTKLIATGDFFAPVHAIGDHAAADLPRSWPSLWRSSDESRLSGTRHFVCCDQVGGIPQDWVVPFELVASP